MRDKAPGGNKPWLSSSPYRCSKRGARPLERARLRRRGSRCAGITLLLGDLVPLEGCPVYSFVFGFPFIIRFYDHQFNAQSCDDCTSRCDLDDHVIVLQTHPGWGFPFIIYFYDHQFIAQNCDDCTSHYNVDDYVIVLQTHPAMLQFSL